MTGAAEPVDRLLLLGNVVIDLVLRVASLPERGTDVLADSGRSTPGGGFNVMAAAARHGLPVAYGGALGSGPFAALARAALAEEGIDVLLPPRRGLDTGVVVSIVDGGGERTFVTAPGAEASLTAADLTAVEAGPRDAVYLSGYGLVHAGNRPALLGWLRRLDGANIVIFDPGPLANRIPPADLADVLRRADWLTCNAREAAILTSQPDPLVAIRSLAAARSADGGGGGGGAGSGGGGGAGSGVIVRTGPDGCWLARRGAAPVHVPGFPVAATDTNGAGDAHTGTFIAALANGAAPLAAARTANAAAALSVTRLGPATAPAAADLARFLTARD